MVELHGSHYRDLLSPSNHTISVRQQHLQGQTQHVIASGETFAGCCCAKHRKGREQGHKWMPCQSPNCFLCGAQYTWSHSWSIDLQLPIQGDIRPLRPCFICELDSV